MERFTEMDEYYNTIIKGIDSTILYENLNFDETYKLTNALNKLARLEDIEEKLGIYLRTLLNALIDGIYVIDDGEILEETISSIERFNDGWGFTTYYNGFELTLSEYGKYWALTEKELEEE